MKLFIRGPVEDCASHCGAFFGNCDSNCFACVFFLLMNSSHVFDSQAEWWEGAVSGPWQFLSTFQSELRFAALELGRRQEFSEIFCWSCEQDAPHNPLEIQDNVQ